MPLSISHHSPTPSLHPHSPATMADPKNPSKRGRANSKNGSDPEDGNKDKNKTRDKYRPTIPKQPSQAPSKAHNGETQGNRLTQDPNKTLTEIQNANLTLATDERGNTLSDPEPDAYNPTQQVEPTQQSCLTPEEEQEIQEYQMQFEEEEDLELLTYSEPFTGYARPLRSEAGQLKDTMNYVLDKLVQYKQENNLDTLDFDDWVKRVSALKTKPTNASQADLMIAYMAETNAYLTRRIRELENSPTTASSNRDPATTATPMYGSNQSSWASIAAKPATNKTQPAQKQRSTTHLNLNTPATPSADPRCLIIRVSPPIPNEERPNGLEARTKINELLEKKGAPQTH